MSNAPILKSHWERYKAHVSLDLATTQQLIAPYSTEVISDLQWLSEGCANTNYKITFADKQPPVVLRIYTREKSALTREIALHRLLEGKVPVPKPLYVNNDCHLLAYPYAIMEWMSGQLMREVILSKDNTAIKACAFEAGRYLNHLRQMTFMQGGFFQEQLKIRPFSAEERYQPFAFGLLEEKNVQASLGMSLHKSVATWIQNHCAYLPNEHEANLTHGDFDPANMLVKQIDGQWKTTAILDWEFAFAGSFLLDAGQFLRYAHKLPPCYEDGFVNGIQSEGFLLSKNWKLQAKLMDMLCLLQLLHYNPLESRPNLNRDVVALIEYTVSAYSARN